MSILNYYRKFDEKSRAFLARYKRIDLFLFLVVVVVLTLIIVNQIRGKTAEARRADISISPQCIDLFGRETMNALIQEFEEQHPDFRILVTGQEPVDVVFFDDGEFSRLIANSGLASLAPYNSAETLSLPLVSFMDIFVYNIDILTAVGLDRPPKTRAEFLTAARTVAEGFPTYAFALSLSPADPLALRRNLYPWVWANGGDVKNLSRVVTDTTTFLGQLNREGLLAPDTFTKTGTQRLEEFAQGKISMMIASSRDIAYLRENARGITLGITAVPMAALGKNRLGLYHIYAGISSVCTQPDQAWNFLAFIAGKKPVLAEALEAVPGSVDSGLPAFHGDYIAQDTVYSKVWDIFEAAEIVEYYPEEAIDGELRAVLTNALKD